MRIGVYLFGLASVAAGIMDAIWGEFEAAHQPIQALSDHIPGIKILAYIAAIWLIIAGAAILWRATTQAGAAALAAIYFIFGAFLFPRFYTAPHFLGHHSSVYIGVLAGVGQQVILVIAALIVFASGNGRHGVSATSLSQASTRIARWTFGLCSVVFGFGHLTAVRDVAPMIPNWMPFGGALWTVLTGIAFVLAGLAILSGILDALAARLLALMLLIFSALVLAPMIFAHPHNHIAWGGNAYNLAAVGAAWIFGDWLSLRRQRI